MVFSERVTNITYNEILPSIVDFVNNSNIFTARVISSPKKWKGVTINLLMRIAYYTSGGPIGSLDQFFVS